MSDTKGVLRVSAQDFATPDAAADVMNRLLEQVGERLATLEGDRGPAQINEVLQVLGSDATVLHALGSEET